MARTGRQIMVAWLQDEMRTATVADLQRAAEFLAFAKDVRKGCTKQRRTSRKSQRSAWRKYLDPSISW